MMQLILDINKDWLIEQHFPALTHVWAAPYVGWYIVALVLWRLLLPFWACLRYPVIFAFAIAGTLPLWGGGLDVNITRTFGYLPFFIVGWQIEPSLLAKVCSDRRVQVCGLFATAILILGMHFE